MATKKTETAAQKFTLDKLRANAMKLFGVSQSTFDGATANLSGSFTVEEIKKKIDSWLTKPITKGGKK